MALNKFETLLFNMMLLVMQKKYRLDDIVIINRQMEDRIALLDCSKVQGASRVRKRCICENAGSILSDERGKLKCHKKVDKPIHASKIFLQFSELDQLFFLNYQ